jgi:PAS domain S-box-containing protein
MPRLTDWDGDGISMFANTAIAGMSSSLAIVLLLCLSPRSERRLRGPITALTSVTALLGGLTLLEHLTGWNLGIDSLVIRSAWGNRASVAPGRMGPPASLTYFLLGLSLLMANTRRGGLWRHISVFVAFLAALPPLITSVAYLYEVDPLYSIPYFTGIARQTAGILLVLTVIAVLLIDETGLGALLKRDDVAGMMVRRLLPIILVLLIVTGWLEDRGVRAGLYNAGMGNALLTVTRVLTFAAVLWWTARVMVLQINRREAIESELDVTQERFRVMVNSIPQLAWMARPDGWIYWYNERWFEYTGTTPRQMEGWGWQSVHDPEVLPTVMNRWKASIATGEPFDMVFPLRGADGKFRPFLTRVLAVRDAKGVIQHWFGTNTDISDQRHAEDALRDANRIKDEFLATLSHELRTPMSAILGWSQMLRGGGASAPQPSIQEIAQGLEVIERNARVQSQIIEDLLDMSRIMSGKVRLDVQSLDVSTLVHAAVDAIRPSAEGKSLSLTVVCDSHVSSVRGDANRMQQVFYNLLTNAVKFTPRGGKIQVHCARVNSHVEIAVSDTGIGMKREFIPHVFDRFSQQDASTTRKFGGLGLGLGIVKHLVELHGGSVHAASEGEGKGSTFTVHIPVSIAVLPRNQGDGDALGRSHPAREEWADEDGVSLAHENLSGLTILVVDDEPDARTLLKRLFDRAGATTVAASSGTQALEHLAVRIPDVLICDIGMPGMDGYELIRAVRKIPPEQGGRTPAIALTAFARSEDRTRSLHSGFQIHLSKPVELNELFAAIASLTGRTTADPS